MQLLIQVLKVTNMLQTTILDFSETNLQYLLAAFALQTFLKVFIATIPNYYAYNKKKYSI